MKYLPLFLVGAVGFIAVPALNMAISALVGFRYPRDFSPWVTGTHEASLVMIGAFFGAVLVWVQFVRQPR